MPRPAAIRKDLHLGWKRIYQLWQLPLNDKIKYSNNLLRKYLKNFNKPVICWSGGRDSTVALHMIRQAIIDIPVIYVNSGVDFPETVQFIDFLADKWNLNLFVSEPEKEENFWSVGAKYGWPIFGKNIASNVERANRSGNIRPQLSKVEKVLANNKIFISARCTKYIQEKPSKIIEKKLGADIKILGLRASESSTRVRLWVDHGDCYKVKDYFGKNKEIWKINPISIWTDKDILEYHNINKIPYCELYKKGYLRNGCWPCAMGIRYGQLRRLRIGHPKLFNFLITKTKMGKEIFKAKLVLKKTKVNTEKLSNNLEKVLKDYPNFFDKI